MNTVFIGSHGRVYYYLNRQPIKEQNMNINGNMQHVVHHTQVGQATQS